MDNKTLSVRCNEICKNINDNVNILQTKLNKINNLDKKDENSNNRLKKWEKCKPKLMKELNKINTQINKFMTNSSSCIRNIESPNIPTISYKLNFGADEDVEMDIDDDDDDDEMDDINPPPIRQVRRRLFEGSDDEGEINDEDEDEEFGNDGFDEIEEYESDSSEDSQAVPGTPPGIPQGTPPSTPPGQPIIQPAPGSPVEPIEDDGSLISSRNIKKYFNISVNIFKEEEYMDMKLYNCLLYSTFAHYMLVDSTEQYHRAVVSIDNIRNKLDLFLFILKDSNSYLAGGYINMAINYPMLDRAIFTDLDIYVNKKNFKELYNQLNNNFRITDMSFDTSSPYFESFFKKNGLLSRIQLKFNYVKLDILIVRDDYNIKDVIKNFDLTYCSVYIDPETIPDDILTNNDISNQKFQIKGNRTDLFNKEGKLNDDYAKNYLFNKFIQNRIKKYTKRGYKTKIQATINTVIDKKHRIINISSIVHKIINKMYLKYKNSTINYVDLVATLSILDYTKENLYKCAKELSSMLYYDENYYYYVIISICDDILADIGFNYLEELGDNPNINPNLSESLRLMNNLYQEIIKIATDKDQLLYTKKPTGISIAISLFNYPQFISIINNIFSNYSVNPNEIDELIKIYKENPNVEIYDILAKSSNKYISNIKYFDVFIVLLNFVDPNLIFTDWIMQNKPRTAVLYNLNEFKNEIQPYKKNGNSQIKFNEYMYFDVYMNMHDITYDEAYNDEDSLLFIMENDLNNGYVYPYNALIADDLQRFNLRCNQGDLFSVFPNNIDNLNKWYMMVGFQNVLGISVSQLYQALSLYKHSNKKIRQFILSETENIPFVTDIDAIRQLKNEYSNIPKTEYDNNIWDESPNRIGFTHCSNSNIVYNKIMYVEDKDE